MIYKAVTETHFPRGKFQMGWVSVDPPPENHLHIGRFTEVIKETYNSIPVGTEVLIAYDPEILKVKILSQEPT